MTIKHSTRHICEYLLLPLRELASVKFLTDSNRALDSATLGLIVVHLSLPFNLTAEIAILLVSNGSLISLIIRL